MCIYTHLCMFPHLRIWLNDFCMHDLLWSRRTHEDAHWYIYIIYIYAFYWYNVDLAPNNIHLNICLPFICYFYFHFVPFSLHKIDTRTLTAVYIKRECIIHTYICLSVRCVNMYVRIRNENEHRKAIQISLSYALRVSILFTLSQFNSNSLYLSLLLSLRLFFADWFRWAQNEWAKIERTECGEH